jgi:hypothetical protein
LHVILVEFGGPIADNAFEGIDPWVHGGLEFEVPVSQAFDAEGVVTGEVDEVVLLLVAF